MKKFIVGLLLTTLLWVFGIAHAVKEIALPEIGDSAGSIISPKQEYQIGLAFFWRLQQSVDLIDDPEVVAYLQSLGYRLVASSDAPGLPFTFFMIPDPRVNAFATPGGFIGINSGLILTSQNEDEVASVIGHEIAHVTQRHIVRSFEKQSQMNFPMMAAMIGAALLGAVDGKAGMAALMAVQAGGVQMQLDFTRANEKEADNIGMLTLVRAGFDPRAMPNFFERLQHTSRFYSSDNEPPEFLRTHPVTENRIAEARGRAETYPVVRQVSDRLQFYLIREKLRVLATRDMRDLIQFYAHNLDAGSEVGQIATRYGYALALLADHKYTRARKALQPLIDQDGDRLAYQLVLADIEIAVGRLSTALHIYEENQKLYPDDQALSIKQSKALLQARLPEEAVDLLERQLLLGAPPRTIYKLLAKAEEARGNKSQSHRWYAEYYYISGQLPRSADQLRIAADYAKGDEYQRARIASRLREVEYALSQLEGFGK